MSFIKMTNILQFVFCSVKRYNGLWFVDTSDITTVFHQKLHSSSQRVSKPKVKLQKDEATQPRSQAKNLYFAHWSQDRIPVGLRTNSPVSWFQEGL